MGLQGLRRNCRILGLVKIIVLVTVLWIGFDSIMQGSMFCKKGMAKKQVVANPIQEQSTLNSIVDYLKVLVSSEGKLTEEEFKELNKTLTSISKLTRNLQEKHEEQVFTYTKVLDQKVPTTEYERTRKKVEEDVIDMWYYLRSNIKILNEMLKSGKRITNTLNSLLEDTDQRTGSLMFNLKKLQQVDGMETWRQKESQELSDLVQRRLTYLQNPKDCSKTNKLVCDIDKNCGFGCQVHHVVYCFIVAYGTQRTLILRSKNWRYSREGWETMFKPISVNCIDEYGVSRANWSESNDAQVIYLPILDEVHPRPPYLPPFIPKDLSDRLIRLHSSPIVWWIGQFLKYLLRPQGSLSKFIKEAEKKVDFNLPVVGIHVRRTDKLWSEAAFHKLEEYMKHVEIFYKQLELKQTVQKRQVYIATDDPNLLEECWNKWGVWLTKLCRLTTLTLQAAFAHWMTHTTMVNKDLHIRWLSMTIILARQKKSNSRKET
ncbi:alpha-(1,6)-fucosyltransferase-like isoform X2 [Tachypleus tridentatus]|uniref:alpha-(1,6)-fucosyltransferase-like isoform X2 n=1 Tax=Tachypleus tridentatus TaxID=6853 RepID=UPI003FD3D48B